MLVKDFTAVLSWCYSNILVRVELVDMEQKRYDVGQKLVQKGLLKKNNIVSLDFVDEPRSKRQKITEFNQCWCNYTICPYNNDSKPSSSEYNKKEQSVIAVCKSKEQCDSAKCKEQSEKIEFAPCDEELEEVLCQLADSCCGCTNTYTDMQCVFNAIQEWNPGKSVWCEGCFMDQANQMGHECLPDPWYGEEINWDERVKKVLLDSENVKELHMLYNDIHEDNMISAENFVGCIQLLLKDRMKKLHAELREKDMLAPGYSMWMSRAQNEYYVDN